MGSNHDNVVFQSTRLVGEKRPRSKKSAQGVSFIVKEDNLLMSTWLNISIDAIRGTDKKCTQMWDIILDCYNEYNKPSNPKRSIVSLTN